MSAAIDDPEWKTDWTREHLARHPDPAPDASPKELRALIGRLRAECFNLSVMAEVWMEASEGSSRVLARRSRTDVIDFQRKRSSYKKKVANMPPAAPHPVDRAIEAMFNDEPDLFDTEIAERLHPRFPRYESEGSLINRVGIVRRRLGLPRPKRRRRRNSSL